jgi:predicted CoA-binding protein
MKKTLVIGASDNPARYAYQAISRLLSKGHPVIALGRKEVKVLGVNVKTAPDESFQDVDTVTLYVSERYQTEYYDLILELNPKRVIFNPGTENPELKQMLESNGIQTDYACTLVMLGVGNY